MGESGTEVVLKTKLKNLAGGAGVGVGKRDKKRKRKKNVAFVQGARSCEDSQPERRPGVRGGAVPRAFPFHLKCNLPALLLFREPGSSGRVSAPSGGYSAGIRRRGGDGSSGGAPLRRPGDREGWPGAAGAR